MEVIISPEVEKFIKSLDSFTIAKVLRGVDLLEEFRHRLGMPHSKKITKNLFELRTRGKQEVRIFYCFHSDAIYLLTGFIKKSQKIPRREVEAAELKYRRLTADNL